MLMRLLRPLVVALGLCLAWEALVRLAALPHYILPAPTRVALALWTHLDALLLHAAITLAEIVLGLVIGTALGTLSALALAQSAAVRRWAMPVIVASQAIPVFALAPLFVLWFGYGMASKVAVATLIIYFPVASAFLDGLRRTEPGWVDLARVMGASPPRILFRLRLPAALPAFASGLRVAAAVAPIGAVIGEWVGASAGLGYVMLQANARMQVDLMFAALILLATFAVALYFGLDALLRRLVPWQRLTAEDDDPDSAPSPKASVP